MNANQAWMKLLAIFFSSAIINKPIPKIYSMKQKKLFVKRLDIFSESNKCIQRHILFRQLESFIKRSIHNYTLETSLLKEYHEILQTLLSK